MVWLKHSNDRIDQIGKGFAPNTSGLTRINQGMRKGVRDLGAQKLLRALLV